MTVNEFFKKENIMSADPFDKSTFKDEITVEDYTKMGAITLARSFNDGEYVPLASGFAVEYAIVVTLLGLEADEQIDGDVVFSAFVCHGLYDKFRDKYSDNIDRERMIMRAEVDLAELISYTREKIDKGSTIIEQIKSVFQKIATDETLLAKIDALVGSLE